MSARRAQRWPDSRHAWFVVSLLVLAQASGADHRAFIAAPGDCVVTNVGGLTYVAPLWYGRAAYLQSMRRSRNFGDFHT